MAARGSDDIRMFADDVSGFADSGVRLKEWLNDRL